MLIKDAVTRARKDLGISTDDTFVGFRYVYFVLKSIRSELLRQEIEKKGLHNTFNLQTLSRFEMEQTDIIEGPVNAGEFVLKSKLPFPELMDTKEGKITSGVILPTGERILFNSYAGTENSKNRRFRPANKAVAYIRNNYLYIRYYDPTVSKLYVDVDGLFEDPEEVDRMNVECVTDDCIYYPDLPFYLPKYLEGRFFRMAKQDISWSYQIQKDKINNGTEDLIPQQQPKQ